MTMNKIFWCRYKNKDGYDESSCKTSHYSPVKTVVTAESFFERSVKKTIGAIRDSVVSRNALTLNINFICITYYDIINITL